LRRKPRRLRVSSIKTSDEASTKKKRKCNECHELGHITKFSQGGPTAKEKKQRLNSSNASIMGANDPSVPKTSKWEH
jgi:hypothetical protein